MLILQPAYSDVKVGPACTHGNKLLWRPQCPIVNSTCMV